MRFFLLHLLGDKPIISILRYSGNQHGWKFKDFHNLCDSKRKTVTLFQIEGGDCIGGYTSLYWQSEKNTQSDYESFLFNMTQ